MRKISLPSSLINSSHTKISSALSKVTAHLSKLGSQSLLHTTVLLEGRGNVIRARESNLCNMLADMVRAYYTIDIAFINSGGVRCDRAFARTLLDEPSALSSARNGTTTGNNTTPPPLTVRDIIDIVPFNNAFTIKRVSAPSLLSSLENSISDAHTDGRFLHYSGLTLVGDWDAPEGQRVKEVWYWPAGTTEGSLLGSSPGVRDGEGRFASAGPEQKGAVRITADTNRTFTIAMAAFIADGFDGYTALRSCPTLVSEEGAMTDTDLVLRVLRHGAGADAGTNTSSHSTEPAEAEEAERLERAWDAVILGVDEASGLPVVGPPRGEGRIRWVGREKGWGGSEEEVEEGQGGREKLM